MRFNVCLIPCELPWRIGGPNLPSVISIMPTFSHTALPIICDLVSLAAARNMQFYSSFCLGIHDVNLVVKPGLLQPFIQYRIRVTGYVGDAKGFSEIELSVNLPPYGGDCVINPNEGITL